MKRLLVIIPDRLSDLIRKGEMTPRYYNPGELFDEVHILMTNDDHPDPETLQETVGRAKLFLYNLPAGKSVFFASLGWRPYLLRRWAQKGIELSQEIRPILVRCHGNYLNGYLGARIKKSLGVPYILSLHTNPKENRKYWVFGLKETLVAYSSKSIEKMSVNYADIVIPVYSSICSYLKQFKSRRIEVIYNIVNSQFLRVKEDYSLHNPPKVIYVGRLMRGKCPDNIIRAIPELNVELTIVGDGPYLNYLQRVVKEARALTKVKFIQSLPNNDLCLALSNYDIFAIHNEYKGIPKTVLEASLVGLPIVLNGKRNNLIPELQGNWYELVENTPDGYFNGIKKVIEDEHFRELLGKQAYKYAREHWLPEDMENKVVTIYCDVMKAYGIA